MNYRSGMASREFNRKLGAWRLPIVLTALILCSLPIAFLLAAIYNTQYFIHHVPGARPFVKVLLKTNSSTLHEYAFKTIGYLDYSNPTYFNTLLSMCKTKDQDEALYVLNLLLASSVWDDQNEKPEKSRAAFAQIRPLFTRYPDDPRFILWAAELIRRLGTPNDVARLEDTYRNLVTSSPTHRNDAMFAATFPLIELKPEMTPYDRMVELNLIPKELETISKYPINLDGWFFSAIESYLSRANYKRPTFQNPQEEARWKIVTQDRRFGDLLFFMRKKVILSGNYGNILFDGHGSDSYTSILSPQQCDRYQQLAIDWLATLPDAFIEKHLSGCHLDDLIEIGFSHIKGDRLESLQTDAYYQAVQRLLDSKWKDRRLSPYHEERYAKNGFKTFGDIFRAILEERHKPRLDPIGPDGNPIGVPPLYE